MREEPPFIVSLRDIPEEGLRRHYVLSGGWAEQHLAEVDAAARTSGLAADVVFTRAGHDVLAAGQLTGAVTLPCGRCLEPADVPVNVAFHMTFVPAGGDAEEPLELELTEQVIDVRTYDLGKIDLEETLREELLLALPYAPVCREDCKGLCPRCGENQNLSACACPPEPTDDRWASLRGVKL